MAERSSANRGRPKLTPQFQSDFNTLADEYEQYRSPYSPALFDAIASYVGPSLRRRALDVACGTGLSTRGLVDRGIAVTGIDVAPNMLAVARRTVPSGASFYEARAESLPFADGAFGLVTCGDAFHWFDADAALGEIRRVLVPGGVHAQFWKLTLPDDPIVVAAGELESKRSGQSRHEVWNALSAGLREAWQRSGLDDRQRVVLEVTYAYTIDSYIGYHSSRETLRLALGERRHGYLDELRALLTSMHPDGSFEIRAKEYLFLGRKGGRA